MLFCWKVRQGLKKQVAIDRICKYVQYFWLHHLQLHFQKEERILFSLLKDRQVMKAIREHKTIRQRVEELIKYSDRSLRLQLSELADLVYEHVRFEERSLFPHLERQLSQEQMQEISKNVEKHRVLLDQYEDQFWNSK